MNHIKKFNEEVNGDHLWLKNDESEFTDEMMDRIYMNGTKDDGKYTLTLTQMEKVAKEMSDWVSKRVKDKNNLLSKRLKKQQW